MAFAEDGENNGANQDEPLTLVETDPVYGADAVSLSPTICLTFSKNVVNMAVKENNSGCFRMTDITGKKVEISLYFPDDQVEPAEKRNIYLTPVEPLSAGTQYVVTVSEALTAKSGAKLAAKTQLVFRTAAEDEPEIIDSAGGTQPASTGGAALPAALSGSENDRMPDSENTPSSEETPVRDSADQSTSNENTINEKASALPENAAGQNAENASGAIGRIYGGAAAAGVILLVAGGTLLIRNRRKRN